MSTISEGKTRDFVATEVTFDADYFSLRLVDGRILSIPYELVPSLSRATDAQRRHCELGGMGTSLHWPDVDEDLSVEGLVLGRGIIDWQKPVPSPQKDK
jgi:hypothetical protein